MVLQARIRKRQCLPTAASSFCGPCKVRCMHTAIRMAMLLIGRMPMPKAFKAPADGCRDKQVKGGWMARLGPTRVSLLTSRPGAVSTARLRQTTGKQTRGVATAMTIRAKDRGRGTPDGEEGGSRRGQVETVAGIVQVVTAAGPAVD